MSIRLNSDQTEYRGVLDAITTQAATETGLEKLLESINKGLTPPLRLRAANPVSRQFFVDSITVTNPENGRRTTIQPISNTLPTFAGGSITLPAASGGSITASGLTLAASYTLTVTAGNFIKILLSLNSSGQVVLTFGTQGASESAATLPLTSPGALAIGYIVAQNVGGTIQNVAETNIYQFIGGGGGSGGGLTTQSVNTGFTAASGTHYLVDTSSAAVTATLPSGTTGAVIRFSDEERTWSARNLTITPASGQSIDGLAVNETLICDVSGAWVQLMWDGLKWVVDTNGYAANISSGSLSGGSGTGEKNYIGNPNNATNWDTSSISLVTVGTESTASNLPDQISQTSAVRITRVSGTTGYAYYRFELDRADYGKKFKIQFDQRWLGTTEGYQVQVWCGASLGSYPTQLTVQTAALTSNLTGTFVTSVDMPGSATPFIEFRIVATGASGTTPLYLNNVYVGPGTVVQGAAVSEWQSFTPQYNNVTLGSGATNQGRWRRVGDTMEFQGLLILGTGGDVTGVVEVRLPTGFTINTTAAPVNSTSAFGASFCIDDSTNTRYVLTPFVRSSTSIAFQPDNVATIATTTVPMDWTQADQLWFAAIVPIAEWAGSGTVNLGPGAQQEFVADNGSADVFGPNGVNIPSIAGSTGGTTRDIVFQYPRQNDDLIVVELDVGTGGWNEASQVTPYIGGTSNWGFGIQGYWLNSTTFRVFFAGGGAYPNNGLGAASTNTWDTLASTWRWRVRKAKASSPVGFGLATTTDAGLVNPYNTSNGVVYSGSYTAVLTASTNVSSVTNGFATYTRVGNLVTVSGNGACAFSANNTASTFFISLPIPSNLTSANDVNGLVVRDAAGIQMSSGYVVADTAGDRAQVTINSATYIVNSGLYYTFQYIIK